MKYSALAMTVSFDKPKNYVLKKFELKVTGELPLRFIGTEIANCDNYQSKGDFSNRWHSIKVFEALDETNNEKYYLLYIHWQTCWRGENSYSEYQEIDLKNKESIKDFLDVYDPIKYLIGYKDSDYFAEKQAKLEKRIVQGWRFMLSELYLQLGFKRAYGRSTSSKDNKNYQLAIDQCLITEAVSLGIDINLICEQAIIRAITESKK